VAVEFGVPIAAFECAPGERAALPAHSNLSEFPRHIGGSERRCAVDLPLSVTWTGSLRRAPRLPVFTLMKVDARAEKCDKQDRGEGGWLRSMLGCGEWVGDR